MNNKTERPTVAYLGPEIPALSATFIYDEILSLEKQGLRIIPFSIHKPSHQAREQSAVELASRTLVLYEQPIAKMIVAHFQKFVTSPLRWLHTLAILFGDIVRMGLLKSSSWKLGYQFLAAGAAARIMRYEQCSHIHIHFAHVPTQVGMYAANLVGVPFSFTSHANDLFERGTLLQEKVERSSSAVTISEYNRDFLEKIGTNPAKIRIVRCSIDSSAYQPRQQKEEDRVPVIGTLGRIVEKKGMDVLVEALAILKRDGVKFKLQIAGDGPLMKALQAQVYESGLQECVTFKGALSHEHVFDWMRDLDLFVLACKKDSNGDQDGIPVVLMEAMALGIPVISTKISGIPELIDDGANGLLAVPGDVKSLTEAIKTLLGDKALAKEYAEAAVERIRDEFDRQVNINRLLEVFETNA